MALCLTIDQGNTAAKTAVWHDNHLVAEAHYRNLTGESIRELTGRFGGLFDASIYSTVRDGGDEIRETMARCSRRFLELTSETPLPIRIAYKTPATLGRDRIAAVAGAYADGDRRWTLVVDCGTAITYDLLSPEGVFVGGNIAPGIFMRLEALNHFTARLPLIETDGDCPQWGCDTETALRAGAINGVVAELKYYRSLLPGDAPRVLITGGSADLVSDKVDFDITVDHNLVSKGLNSIINYNENL